MQIDPSAWYHVQEFGLPRGGVEAGMEWVGGCTPFQQCRDGVRRVLGRRGGGEGGVEGGTHFMHAWA